MGLKRATLATALASAAETAAPLAGGPRSCAAVMGTADARGIPRPKAVREADALGVCEHLRMIDSAARAAIVGLGLSQRPQRLRPIPIVVAPRQFTMSLRFVCFESRRGDNRQSAAVVY